MNAGTVALCIAATLALALEQRSTASSLTATYVKLPALAGPSEALAVDQSGKFIAGHTWDRQGFIHGIRWTFANGAWTMTDMPLPPNAGAICVIARAVNNNGDVAGNTTPASSSRPVLWPFAGGSLLLDCGGEIGAATPFGMSAGAQILVGGFRQDTRSTASVWRPGTCRQALPPLVADTAATAYAVNGDGTVIGGTAANPQSSNSVPVRWRSESGWQIEQLDIRGGGVAAANAIGDLAGHVTVSCAVADGCTRAKIWSVNGSARELATLGGTDSWARGINASGEVVGGSTLSNGTNTAFFWSGSTGLVQLPIKTRWGAANAVSDVRPDGSRVVVGMDAAGNAIAWTVKIQ